MQLSELRNRASRFQANPSLNIDRDDGEEVLVKDQRANLSPAQIVEQKLRGVLHHGLSFFTQTSRRQGT